MRLPDGILSSVKDAWLVAQQAFDERRLHAHHPAGVSDDVARHRAVGGVGQISVEGLADDVTDLSSLAGGLEAGPPKDPFLK